MQVHCFVLECGGSEVPALAMAAGLAVADAQIDMCCTLSAACVVRALASSWRLLVAIVGSDLLRSTGMRSLLYAHLGACTRDTAPGS